MDSNPSDSTEGAVSESAPNPEKVAAARELVSGILERMGVGAELALDDRADGIHLGVKVRTGGEALAGGAHSGVIESLGYLVNKAMNRDEQGRKWVFIEVEGEGLTESAPVAAGVAPDPALAGLAADLAARAKAVGGAVWASALPKSMRGGLQAALAQVPGVKVRAEGEGAHRRLVIEAV